MPCSAHSAQRYSQAGPNASVLAQVALGHAAGVVHWNWYVHGGASKTKNTLSSWVKERGARTRASADPCGGRAGGERGDVPIRRVRAWLLPPVHAGQRKRTVLLHTNATDADRYTLAAGQKSPPTYVTVSVCVTAAVVAAPVSAAGHGVSWVRRAGAPATSCERPQGGARRRTVEGRV